MNREQHVARQVGDAAVQEHRGERRQRRVLVKVGAGQRTEFSPS